MARGLEKMLGTLKSLRINEQDKEKPYALYMVGGFDDDRNSSKNLTLKLFSKRHLIPL